MRVLLQRVSDASVTIDGEAVGAIGRGFVLLVGITASDDAAIVEKLAGKVANLRVFADEAGAMNRAALDLVPPGTRSTEGGFLRDEPVAMLVVSQFTLYADARKGRRPSFVGAARPEQASPLVDRFVEVLRGFGLPVATGRFGADMAVALTNDGPVTIWLDSDEL
ncbi:MAG TPA: D-aminoacyl-tRNA deacylase [Thermomicrobiales bacterium]|jgi:D-tyrosyl-tRNA(Tyr) deacylase|nr:D-aminoacyl-tRNA deacylase [Thermomicrobiales bacterium]